MKDTPRSTVYNNFSNPKILDDFINGVGAAPSTPINREKPPVYNFISVPEPQKRPKSILSNSSSYRNQQPPPEPYIIPINVTKTNSLYSTPRKETVPNMEYTSVSEDNDVKKEAVIITETVDPEPKPDSSVENEPVQRNSVLKKKPEDLDGSVLIHVDNLSLPLMSARSSNANSSLDTSSNRSVIGSTPGNLTPERRDSVSGQTIVDRNSAKANALSPDSSSEGSVP